MTRVDDATESLDGWSPVRRYGFALAASLGFAFALLYCVDNFIAGPFRYLGYVPRDWSGSEMLVAALCTAVLVAFTGSRISSVGAGALVFLAGFVGIPLIWLPVQYGVLSQEQLTVFNILVTLCFGVSRGVKALIPLFRLPRLPDYAPVQLLLAVVAGAGLVFVVASTGVSLDFLSFADVYEQRDEYSSASSPAVAYTVGWVGSGILPVLATMGVRRKSLALAVVGFGGLLIIYLLTGFKSYILGATLVFAAAVLISKRQQISSWTLYGAMMAVPAVAMILDRLSGDLIFTSIAVRRAFSTAGINSAYFFDFFTGNPTYRLRHSVLAFLGNPPHHLTPARLIGARYYGSNETAANANYLADGLANFGVLGMFGAAILMGVWLGVLESFARDLSIAISFPAVLIVLVTFANTASLTVLATHGGVMILVSLWMVQAAHHEHSSEKSSCPARALHA